MALNDVLRALSDAGLKRTTNGWMAKCPGHDDRAASLSIGQGDDGKVVLKCFTGCDVEKDIVPAMGLKTSDLFQAADKDEEPIRRRIVKEYDYRDEKGTLLYQACRFEPKGFTQRRPNGAGGGWLYNLEGVRRVLYRLPELLEKPQATVYIPEGEKDCDKLHDRGLLATTNVGGAGKWKREYSEFLRGRHVVILPDNDEPGEKHAAMVVRALENIAASVRIVRLPDLPPKGDVSDWFTAGGDEDKLLSLVFAADESRTSFTIAAGKKERLERIADGNAALQFGVRFLDEAFCGIVPTDIILFGAKSGIGKTSLATIVALNNCTSGKRVHFFALEAEAMEIERRMKYQIIADMYYADPDRANLGLIRFPEWRLGRLDAALGRYEDEADRELERRLANLSITYNLSQTFTAEEFCETIESLKGKCDLAVLDHVHFLHIEEKDENRGLKLAMQMIQRCAFSLHIPLLVVAHLRKSDRRNETIIPSMEEFHGSSDVFKIATKAVMMAPAHKAKRDKPYLCPTYMQCTKNRQDGSVTWYVSEMVFNAKRSQYEQNYLLGELADGGREFATVGWGDLPQWAKSARNGEDPKEDEEETP